jgi:hypothetical protein
LEKKKNLKNFNNFQNIVISVKAAQVYYSNLERTVRQVSAGRNKMRKLTTSSNPGYPKPDWKWVCFSEPEQELKSSSFFLFFGENLGPGTWILDSIYVWN